MFQTAVRFWVDSILFLHPKTPTKGQKIASVYDQWVQYCLSAVSVFWKRESSQNFTPSNQLHSLGLKNRLVLESTPRSLSGVRQIAGNGLLNK